MQGCRRSIVLLSLLALLAPAGGCGSNKLETGYVYTPLGSTASQRRGYYAGPFSPEARKAMMDEIRADENAGGMDRRTGR